MTAAIFCGWQTQKNGTIQSVLEAALSRLFSQPISCRAAGRTDAGFTRWPRWSAFATSGRAGACADPRFQTPLPPKSVAVVAAEVVAEDFDARFQRRASYRYQIWNAVVRSPQHQVNHWHVAHPLDIAAILKRLPPA